MDDGQMRLDEAPNYGERFDGSDYVPDLDDERLTTQLARVYRATRDHEWHTILDIKQRTGIVLDASVAKHLRHLRYERFGAYEVEKRRVGDAHNGVWEYRVGRKGSGHPRALRRISEPVLVTMVGPEVVAVRDAEGRRLDFEIGRRVDGGDDG